MKQLTFISYVLQIPALERKTKMRIVVLLRLFSLKNKINQSKYTVYKKVKLHYFLPPSIKQKTTDYFIN